MDLVRAKDKEYGSVLMHLSGTGPANLLSSGVKTGRLASWGLPWAGNLQR